MAPTVYWMPISPPARSVLLCAAASGIELNLKELDLFKGEHLTTEYLKLSPQHTIPILVEEDGFVLNDSHAIMTYLVDKYGKDKSLYPTDLRKRATVDHRLHFDSSVLCLRGMNISKGIHAEGVKEITPYQRQQLREAFEIAEKYLENSKWAAGDALTIADFCFASSITSWANYERLDQSRYPKINAWLREMEKLPYFKPTNDPGIQEYAELVKKKLAELSITL